VSTKEAGRSEPAGGTPIRPAAMPPRPGQVPSGTPGAVALGC